MNDTSSNVTAATGWHAPCDCDKIDRPIECHACIAKQCRHAGPVIEIESCPHCCAMWTWHPVPMKPIVLKERGSFRKKPFKGLARKMWEHFFKTLVPGSDLAHWEVDPNSATILLSARNSSVSETNSDWEPPAPVIAAVNGIVQLLNANPDFDEELCLEFSEWVTLGIMQAFKSASISKKFKQYLKSNQLDCFAIVTSPFDEGLIENDLALLWSKNDCLSVKKIKARQKAAAKYDTKRPVKKKPLRKR